MQQKKAVQIPQMPTSQNQLAGMAVGGNERTLCPGLSCWLNSNSIFAGLPHSAIF